MSAPARALWSTAYDDFTIAEVACGLDHPTEAKLFAGRANNWQNLWDKNLSAEGFKGFLRPRNTDGSWAAPDLQVRGTWPDFFYEGDLWTYSLYAPQDVRRLIANDAAATKPSSSGWTTSSPRRTSMSPTSLAS